MITTFFGYLLIDLLDYNNILYNKSEVVVLLSNLYNNIYTHYVLLLVLFFN